MKRVLLAFAILIVATASVQAQSLDDLNIQIHGYATQGFLYTTNNNIFTANSSDGSPAWTEAVVNLSAVPIQKLRIAVQARYFLLGNFGNAITVDYALADYKVNDRFGMRFGKVKTPTGLLNEFQDIDPSYLWSLLPQSVYSLPSRNSLLSHFGGVVYGKWKLGEVGKVAYYGYAGQRLVASGDALFQPLRDKGIALPNGATGPMYGGSLHWDTPVRGLMLGATEDSEHTSGQATLAAFTGMLQATHFYQPYIYSQYERKRLMVAGEYTRQALNKTTSFVGGPTIFVPKDQRAWYAMASYKLTAKLTAGAYYSSTLDRKLPVSSARFQKDWVVSGRYELNQFLYVKAEQHFLNGTELGYSTSNNAGGIKPSTKLSVLKVGVSF
jgi:hypothetical protein